MQETATCWTNNAWKVIMENILNVIVQVYLKLIWTRSINNSKTISNECKLSITGDAVEWIVQHWPRWDGYLAGVDRRSRSVQLMRNGSKEEKGDGRELQGKSVPTRDSNEAVWSAWGSDRVSTKRKDHSVDKTFVTKLSASIKKENILGTDYLNA